MKITLRGFFFEGMPFGVVMAPKTGIQAKVTIIDQILGLLQKERMAFMKFILFV
jgi:hypothetical protein